MTASDEKDSLDISNSPVDDQQVVEKDDKNAVIPQRYRGTDTDQYEMGIMGKKQVLKRNFKFITMLGFASTATASWEFMMPTFYFTLFNTGPAMLFWAVIIGAPGMTMVYASLAEMASMSPTAGGQYHWVSELSPPKYQKFLSYLTGWLCAIGWQVYLAGVAFMVGGILQGLIALNVEDYVWKQYHGTLLTIAVILFAIAFNSLLASRLPLIEGTVLILHLAGFFGIIIPLWVMAPRAHPSILTTFEDYGGWGSKGLAAMVGMTAPMSTLLGYDCSVHMSEEVQDASVTLPRAIVWSVVPNAALALVMGTTLLFTMGDQQAILAGVTGQPFIQIFYNATQSYAATNAMTSIIVILLVACCFSEVATSSRQLWSFARDGGLPGSKWLQKVTPGWDTPFRAVLVSVAVTCCLSLINLGSSVALNAINSLGGVAIISSYVVSIGTVLHRRITGPPLPPRRWSLGEAGIYINIGALLFLAPFLFFFFWPLAINPLTAQDMNWSSVMFVGTLSFAIIYYFARARHVYVGPVVQMKRDE